MIFDRVVSKGGKLVGHLYIGGGSFAGSRKLCHLSIAGAVVVDKKNDQGK